MRKRLVIIIALTVLAAEPPRGNAKPTASAADRILETVSRDAPPPLLQRVALAAHELGRSGLAVRLANELERDVLEREFADAHPSRANDALVIVAQIHAGAGDPKPVERIRASVEAHWKKHALSEPQRDLDRASLAVAYELLGDQRTADELVAANAKPRPAVLAIAAARRGDLQRADQLVARDAWRDELIAVARAAIAAGDKALAKRMLDAAEKRLEAQDHVSCVGDDWTLISLVTARVDAGDTPSALALLRATADRVRSSPDTPACLLLGLATAFSRAGDASAAGEMWTLFDSAGGDVYVAQASAEHGRPGASARVIAAERQLRRARHLDHELARRSWELVALSHAALGDLVAAVDAAARAKQHASLVLIEVARRAHARGQPSEKKLDAALARFARQQRGKR